MDQAQPVTNPPNSLSFKEEESVYVSERVREREREKKLLSSLNMKRNPNKEATRKVGLNLRLPSLYNLTQQTLEVIVSVRTQTHFKPRPGERDRRGEHARRRGERSTVVVVVVVIVVVVVVLGEQLRVGVPGLPGADLGFVDEALDEGRCGGEALERDPHGGHGLLGGAAHQEEGLVAESGLQGARVERVAHVGAGGCGSDGG